MVGDYNVTETVHLPFNTFTSNDPSESATITDLVAGDIKIHADGAVAERTSASGVTISVDFDGITGNHIAHIDLSDNTDAGFYAVGSTFQVRIEGTTVDAGTINAWIGTFSIGRTLRPTVDGRTLDITATGGAGIDWGNVENSGATVDLSATSIDLCDEVTLTDTATDVSNQVTADMTAISGDTTAANNLESQYDETGLSGDTFPATQAQIGSLSVGTASISTTSSSFEKTGAEPETNDYTDTATLNGTYHIVEDDSTATDVYYQFLVGGNGVPVAFSWDGYAQSQGDSYTVWAYNYTTPGYEQIGSLTALAGTTQIHRDWDLTTAHVGAGADSGKVRCRFLSADGTAIATDRILCSYAVVSQSVGYANGAIWIDTENGEGGIIDFTNGVADNPVDNIADAITLAGSIGLNRFHVAQGSSITFAATMDNYEFMGVDYTIDFSDEQVDNTVIQGANISGVATGNGGSLLLLSCQFAGATTLPEVAAIDCAMAATVTLAETGDYIFERCFSAIAGSGAPILDVGAAIGNQNINFRHYSGGLDLRNMQAGDTMSYEGMGQLIVTANCIGGAISIRGLFSLTDNGSATITQDARYNVSQATGSVTGAVGSVTGAVGSVAGNVDGSTGSVTGAVGSVAGNVDGDVSGDLLGDVQGNVDGSVGSVTGAVGSVSGSVGSVAGNVDGNVDGTIEELAAQAKADVNAEVLDVMNVDTHAEPGQEAPTSTTTLVDKIGYIYKFLRNKVTQTATETKVYNDAGSTVDQKRTVSDDATVATTEEWEAGP